MLCAIQKKSPGGVLKNFAKFPGKNCVRVSFLMWLQPSEHLWPEDCNYIKKETLTQVLSCEFCEISKDTCLTEHPLATAFSRKSSHLLLITLRLSCFPLLIPGHCDQLYF